MITLLAPRTSWLHLFHPANLLGPRGKTHHDMTSTTNHRTTASSPSTDIDTSLFPSDPAPELVAEAKAAVLTALAASPDAVIDRAYLARTLPGRLTDPVRRVGSRPSAPRSGSCTAPTAPASFTSAPERC
ncbi:hypothetical protein FK529_08815 [Tsukamurella asaccharolytica]|uniref:Uncharacterized protein n=1 Tax=Tsukamurella asaccharolytica TaxID=2592067 RepID=A0A5C5RAR4_9ACTN|nr:hypothetical protein [Tsukamurella asaccharolytica]TWS20207.1 hypothetical protein FK529_08815 [Tsukamurella asaccharolytica]